MENKPFIFGVATSGDNFTDRKKELIEIEMRQVVIPDPVMSLWLKRELGV